MARINKATSPYYTTPTKDFYLDLMVDRDIAPTDNDRLLTLTATYHKRPDVLSQDLFGTPRLWWVFAARNKNILIDPIEDFVSGLQIVIPGKEAVENLG